MKKYVRALEKRGFTVEQIDRELVVDPESPINRATLSAVQGLIPGYKHTRADMEAAYDENWGGVDYRWVTVLHPSRNWPAIAEEWLQDDDLQYKFGEPGTGPCPDCLRREGRIEPLEMWTAIGEPGAGATVCKGNCRCKLVEVK